MQEVAKIASDRLLDGICMTRLLELVARNAEQIIFDDFAQRAIDATMISLLLSQQIQVCLYFVTSIPHFFHSDLCRLTNCTDLRQKTLPWLLSIGILFARWACQFLGAS